MDFFCSCNFDDSIFSIHSDIISCLYVRTIDNFPHTFAELAEGKSLHDWIIGNGYNLYEGEPQQVLQRILDIAIQFAWVTISAVP